MPCKEITIEAVDRPSYPIRVHFSQAIDFIRRALTTNEDNVVLVHCTQGRSRSVAVVAAYLVESQHISVRIRQRLNINASLA